MNSNSSLCSHRVVVEFNKKSCWGVNQKGVTPFQLIGGQSCLLRLARLILILTTKTTLAVLYEVSRRNNFWNAKLYQCCPKLSQNCFKVISKLSKSYLKVVQSCPKVVPKLSPSFPKVISKLSKVVPKLSPSLPKIISKFSQVVPELSNVHEVHKWYKMVLINKGEWRDDEEGGRVLRIVASWESVCDLVGIAWVQYCFFGLVWSES